MNSPCGTGAKEKRPERQSAGRRSIEVMANYALKSGAASSVEDLLDQVAGVRGRKLFNALLAVLQLPHATLLCGADEWEMKWGRRVRFEERPLVLLFPFGPVEFVYDVSQTEDTQFARPLPMDAAPFAMAHMLDARESVAKLSAAAEGLGVRVVSARQGTSLAGKIRRTEDAGVLRIPTKVPGELREVPVRWVIALNQSHSPTEHLATLAHELGHLFCGHVSADQGDSWPNRPGLSYKMREFEAESVARLVFRRIAPTAELPPYLEHILEGESPPDQGWTYVAQAADTVLELLGIADDDRAIEHTRSTSELPGWVADVGVRAGDSESSELIVVRATNDDLGLPERVSAAWATGTVERGQPWIAAARSTEAFDGLLAYFKYAQGEDDEHDAYRLQLERWLPLGTHEVTVVSAGSLAQSTLVELRADPPAHGETLWPRASVRFAQPASVVWSPRSIRAGCTPGTRPRTTSVGPSKSLTGMTCTARKPGRT